MEIRPNIVVCIKQVPDTDRIRFDPEKGTIIRDPEKNMINPNDYHAIEQALRLRDEYGGKITVITMGPPYAEKALREAYAYGVDSCVLITDPAFAGSDTLVTSKILYRAIRKLGDFDFIITGFETSDGNTGQVSYQLAEYFGIPHLTQINSVEIEDGYVKVSRRYGHEFQVVRAKLPVLLAMKMGSNNVRHPRLADIKTCFSKEIRVMGLKEIGGSPEEYGIEGSPTVTIGAEIVKHKRKREVFGGTVDEKVEKLVKKLKKYRILKH